MTADERAQMARNNFLQGYNCSQSVVLAFPDILAQAGIEPSVAARLASPFGGGMGRMREVCGAVSGMLMILGLAEGYDEAKAFLAKKELYQKVQTLCGRYREENGSIVCRELLGLSKGPDNPTPQQRTEGYYRKRPCPELCACAARILAEHLGENEE
ncbi:MAG: C_GCAxxG_C_C family protein [Atopobiaceae bacterium]|nr:C_GCAxxG_C_C family protein [Atopobiaceae bacterium]